MEHSNKERETGREVEQWVACSKTCCTDCALLLTFITFIHHSLPATYFIAFLFVKCLSCDDAICFWFCFVLCSVVLFDVSLYVACYTVFVIVLCIHMC